jgi:transcriptional regulator with XRE-family HTH domain
VPRPTALIATPGLRRLRLERLLTQRQLAERAELALSVIGRLEAGGEARFSTVAKLAEALNVDPRDLTRPDGGHD